MDTRYPKLQARWSHEQLSYDNMNLHAFNLENQTLLSKLMGLEYIPNHDGTRVRRIAAIANSFLLEKLRDEYRVLELVPGCVAGTLDKLPPDFVVIQNSSLSTGLWSGCTDGQALSSDLIEIRNWGRSTGGHVVVLMDDDSFGTEVLDQLDADFFPNSYFFERVEGNPRRSKVFEILHDYGKVIKQIPAREP